MLCAVDLIGLIRPHVRVVIQRLQTTGCCVIIARTHTHHGPDMLGLWGPDTNTSGVDQAYLDELQDKLAAVISAALEDI